MRAIIQCPSLCDECTARVYRYEVDPTTNSFNGGNSDGHRALNTGMYIEEGSNLEVQVAASDQWGIGVGQLVPATGSSQTYSYPGPPPLQFPVGALVARIGSSGNWFLAANYRDHAPASGVLELMQWDSESNDNGHDRLTVKISSVPASCDPCFGIFCTLSIPACPQGQKVYTYRKPGACCPSYGCVPLNADSCPAVRPNVGDHCPSDGVECGYDAMCCCGNLAAGDCTYTARAVCRNGAWALALALIRCVPEQCAPTPPDPCADILCPLGLALCDPGKSPISVKPSGECCAKRGCLPTNPAACPATLPSGSCSGDLHCAYNPSCCCGNFRDGDCAYTSFAECVNGQWQVMAALIACLPDACSLDPCKGIACAQAIPACPTGQHVRTYRNPGDCCDRYECVPDPTCPAEIPSGGTCNWDGVCYYNQHCCCNNGAPGDCIFITHAACDNGELHIALADRVCPNNCNDPCAGIACARPVPACQADERLRTYREPGDCCDRYECVPATPANCPNDIPADGHCNWDGVCLYNKQCCCNDGRAGDCVFINHAACDNGELHLAIADIFCQPEACDPCYHVMCAMAIPTCESGKHVRKYRNPGDCCDRYECVPDTPANCPNELPKDTCNWEGTCLMDQFCCCHNGAPNDCTYTTHATCTGGQLAVAMASILCADCGTGTAPH